MKERDGIFFPEGDEHFINWPGGAADYQRKQSDAALACVREFACAVDIGAHIGLFSRRFAARFDEVFAFEPVPELQECLWANAPANVRLMPFALADVCGAASFRYMTRGNSGGSFLEAHGVTESKLKGKQVLVEVRTLDSFELDRVGLIKVDVQGADYQALLGAQQTIARCRPVLLVEEKPIGGPNGSTEHFQLVWDLMDELKMVRGEKVGADRIYTPQEPA
jgi:FkbM family methyltransferase